MFLGEPRSLAGYTGRSSGSSAHQLVEPVHQPGERVLTAGGFVERVWLPPGVGAAGLEGVLSPPADGAG